MMPKCRPQATVWIVAELLCPDANANPFSLPASPPSVRWSLSGKRASLQRCRPDNPLAVCRVAFFGGQCGSLVQITELALLCCTVGLY